VVLLFVGGTLVGLPKRLEVLVLLFMLANMPPVCCGRGCARLLPNREVEGWALVLPNREVEGCALVLPNDEAEGCALVLPNNEVEGCALVLPNKLELCACGA